jgi:PAS domain S-box-containing protein
MSWIEVVWPMMGAASLTLGLIHLFIWLRTRRRVEHLLFVVVALGIAVMGIFELLAMREDDPGDFAALVRYVRIPGTITLITLVSLVRVRFQAGSLWLAWAFCAVRTLSLIPNFLTGVNLNFLEVSAMQRVDIAGGDHIYAPIGTPNPWLVLAEISNVVLILFMISATIEVWRRSDPLERMRALWFCGSVALFLLLSTGFSFLISHGLLHLPYLTNAAFLGMVVVMSYDLGGDVVRSVETARRLRETEQRMELAGEAAELGLYSWDVASDRVWLSENGRALYGFGRDQPLTLAEITARIHPEDRERIRREIGASVEDGSGYDRAYRIVLPSGRVRRMQVRGRVERDGAGQATSLYGVMLDLSARDQAEQRFRVAVEAAPSAMLLVDAEGRILLVNVEAERVFGYQRDELVGQGIELLLPEALRAPHHDHRQRYHAEPAVRPMGARRELAARRKDGATMPVEIGLSPIESAEGALVLASVTDISERVRHENEAAQQRGQLAHLARVATLGELSGSLAHDLNQPLAAILANAQAVLRMLRKEGPRQDDAVEALEDIVADDKRAGDVIQRLRAMLKKEQVPLRPLDPNALVHEVIRLYRSDLLSRGVAIELELAHGLPDVIGDRVQLLQVLLNLLINACDAMAAQEAPRLIRIRTERESEATARISVCDNGPGIDATQLERVFEPFVTTKQDGMGLGLPVCRTIMHALGGRLWAENVAGGGACFRVELPVAAG